MKFTEFLQRALVFRQPSHAIEQADKRRAWQRWCDAVDRNDNHQSDISLGTELRVALKPEVTKAIWLVALNTLVSFVTAVALKRFLQMLVEGPFEATTLVGYAAGIIVGTMAIWISLNHIFYVSALIGVGARTYTERRILAALGRAKVENLKDISSLSSFMDRESSRIEGAWGGTVMILLALATLLVTVAFFFVALGSSAVAALLMVVLSTLSISHFANKMSDAYEHISTYSRNRLELGAYAVKNRIAINLNGWVEQETQRYQQSRQHEATALKRVGRLIAYVNAISTVTPIAALLMVALTQVYFYGEVDIAGLMAAIALIGGLRSVANNVPAAIAHLTQGKVAHRGVNGLLNTISARQTCSDELPTPSGRHIAISGAPGSGRTTVLRKAMQHLAVNNPFYLASEPWIYSGTLVQNLTIDSDVDFSSQKLAEVLAQVRLSPDIGLDEAGKPRVLAGDNWGISRGQSKRVELARALLSGADGIFLDQPTMALDPDLAEGLLCQLLAGPWAEQQVVFVSDKPEELALADEIWQVQQGKVVAVEQQVKTSPEVSKPVEGYPNECAGLLWQSPGAIMPEDSTAKKISRFNLTHLLWIMITLLLLKEAVAIAGDYVLTHAQWSDVARSTFYLGGLAIVATGLSIASALWAVIGITDKASAFCHRYFKGAIALEQQLSGTNLQDKMGRMTRDQRQVDEALPSVALECFGAMALLCATFGYVILTNPLLTIALAPLVLLYLYLNKRGYKPLTLANLNELDTTGRLLQNISELPTGLDRLNVSKSNTGVLNWLERQCRTRAFASIDNFTVQRWFGYQVDLTGALIFCCVIVGAVIAKLNGVLDSGGALALSLCYAVISIFGRFARNFVQFRQVMDSADRLVLDETKTELEQHDNISTTAVVYFDKVGFGYQSASKPLFDELTLALDAGQDLAIVGVSGSGKSTIASLLCAEYQPCHGQVRLNGQVVSRQVVLNQVQFFSSEPLFSPGPLYCHFGLGAADKSRLLDFAKALGAQDIVQLLPQGVDYEVGQNGQLPLSKSQVQRLALVRALTCPSILCIFDEATSELSQDEEIALKKQLRDCAGEHGAMIFITHNHGLAAVCDKQLSFGGEGVKLTDNTHDEDPAS